MSVVLRLSCLCTSCDILLLLLTKFSNKFGIDDTSSVVRGGAASRTAVISNEFELTHLMG